MNTTNPVRMRVAPSPTGEPHVGTAYIALFNVLLAEKYSGEMILRIEDTDLSRSTPEAEEKLLAALKWLGLTWSEGPDKGGPYGPYRQSERKDIYAPYVHELIEKGHAFKCFCTRERLDEMRKAQKDNNLQTKYDGLCLGLSPEHVEKLSMEGVPHVVRMKVPDEGYCSFQDGIHGTVSIPYDTVDMQIILKADGMPTYHFANVIDDHLMKITHVARGEEWLSSVPKHILLYRYLGWDAPLWYHLPLLRNPDRSKLSKRRNPTSISYYQRVGYLPDALINFLGLLFISISEGDELMDINDLFVKFDPDAMSKSGAVFDPAKLTWLNARWIREKVAPKDFLDRVKAWALDGSRLELVLGLAQGRINTLGDLPGLIGFAFAGDLHLKRSDFEALKCSTDFSLEVIRAAQAIVDTVQRWDSESIRAEVERIASDVGSKIRVVVPPLYLAITGSTRSLPLFDSMAVLGRSIVRDRLAKAAALLA